MSLNDILTAENMTLLLQKQPNTAPLLLSQVPSDFTLPVTSKTLRDIAASPQFQSAVRNFDNALRTGLLGNLVRSLGLPEEAGLSVESFLRAVDDQAKLLERSGDSHSDMGTN